jgi:hypothetical protein
MGCTTSKHNVGSARAADDVSPNAKCKQHSMTAMAAQRGVVEGIVVHQRSRGVGTHQPGRIIIHLHPGATVVVQRKKRIIAAATAVSVRQRSKKEMSAPEGYA